MSEALYEAVRRGFIPAAVRKAEAMSRFANSQGSPLCGFEVALSLAEAFELLDYIGAGGLGYLANQELLLQDIEAAKAKRDPWTVLSNFQLYGMGIGKAKELN